MMKHYKLTPRPGFDPKPFWIGQIGVLIEGFLMLMIGFLPFTTYSAPFDVLYIISFFLAPVVMVFPAIGIHGFYRNYGCKDGDMRRMLVAIPMVIVLIWLKSTIFNEWGPMFFGWVLIFFLNAEYAILGVSLFGLRRYFKDNEPLWFFLSLTSLNFIFGGCALSIFYVVMHMPALTGSYMTTIEILFMYGEIAVMGVMTFGLFFLFRAALPKSTRATKGPKVIGLRTIVEPME